MILDNIDLQERVYIIAEAGINHEGKLDNALQLINDAADVGVDCIKFQSYYADKFINRSNKERHAQRTSFQFSNSEMRTLAEYAVSKGLSFLSTPLDRQSANDIENYSIAFKIASLDLCNYHLLEHVLKKDKPLIISTGLHSVEEILSARDFIVASRGEDYLRSSVAFLHCISSYPTTDSAQLNMRSIQYLRDICGTTTGYSDHSLGPLACFAAVSLGARIIEKHFTFDKTMTGVRDHVLSADKEEMKNIVDGIRYIEKALGNYGKQIASVESENKRTTKRYFVLNKELTKGSVIDGDHLESVLGGAEGICSTDYFKVKGKKLNCNKAAFDLLQWSDFE